jgi:hypothetical protein
MVEKNTKKIQSAILEVDEAMTADDLLINLLQDLVSDSDPANLATDFIDNFVLGEERPETSQILAMFDMPTETLVEMVNTIIETSYAAQIQAVNERGHEFLEGLKAAVKAKMLKLADG